MENQPRPKFTPVRGWSLTGTRQHQEVKGGLTTENTITCGMCLLGPERLSTGWDVPCKKWRI